MSAAPGENHGMPIPHDYTPQPRVNGTRLDDLVGQRFAVISRTPVSTTDWAPHAAMLDAATAPELQALLDRYCTDELVIRPDRYVLAADVSRHLNGART
jgi:hypothetical protein